jgi:hypothetical protein
LGRAFEDFDFVTGLGGGDGYREACQAAADDYDPLGDDQ